MNSSEIWNTVLNNSKDVIQIVGDRKCSCWKGN